MKFKTMAINERKYSGNFPNQWYHDGNQMKFRENSRFIIPLINLI